MPAAPRRPLPMLARGPWVLACLLWLLFVVYGSLVPLEWRAVPWEQAVAQFRSLPWLDLGAVSRADWVANIVLYVPLGFLGCAAWLGFRPPAWLVWPGALLVLVVCLGVAAAVEFTQTFFAPRTVSRNDLLAEAIGAALGVCLWLFGRGRVLWLADSFACGGRASVTAALAVAALAYLLLSLFPFDFVVSLSELGERLNRGVDGWLFGACSGWARCIAVALAEVAAIAPLGLLLVLRAPQVPSRTLLLVGLGIGLALELGQLLIFSGSSRGLSVLLRGAGLVAGGALGRLLLTRLEPSVLAGRLAPWLPLFILSWALAAILLSGWFAGAWLTPAAALARLPDLGWVPFYYHYWTTEPEAMASLLAQLALYLPIGLAVWVWSANNRRHAAWPVVPVTVLAALLTEAGKLFFAGARPDPSNLIIAPMGALAGYWGAWWFTRAVREQRLTAAGCALRQRAAAPPPRAPSVRPVVVAAGAPASGAALDSVGRPAGPWPTVGAPAPAGDDGADGGNGASAGVSGGLVQFLRSQPALPKPRWPLATPAALPAAVALVGLVLYPVWSIWLGLALALYGAALWFRPWILLLVLPVALAGLDAGPVTGRLLLDELDLLVLVSLAVLIVRLSGVRPAHWPVPLLPVAVVLLWVAWLLGTWIGLGGAEGLSAAPRAASHTPLAAWHVGKGLLWALLLIGPLRRLRRVYGSAATSVLLLDGVVLALAWTTAVVLWERHVHVGLWDFGNVFRVTGPFASMQTGGAYLEAFLAFAFPLLLVWLVRRRGWWLRLFGVLLVPLTGYSMLVTFSRAGYGALLLVVLVLGASVLLGPRRRAGWRAWALPAALVVLLAALAVPALTTGFARQRLSLVEQDLRFRLGHWAGALALMGHGVPSLLFGEGFGRYPLAYLLAGRGQPGTFLVEQGVLRLGAGEAVFLDQWVRVRPDTTYRLSARLRALEAPDLALGTPLCHKALLYSFACVPATLAGRSEDGGWVAVTTEINSGEVGRGGNWPRGPVKLALHNAGAVALDVDDLSLRGPDGRELIANGGFSAGADRWLFVSDQDLAWHIHQQWVEMFFAQGLLGLLAFLLLLLGTARVLWPALRAGRLEALALTAALAGFLAVGLLGSTMDAARPMLLCYFSTLSAALLVRGPPRQSRR